MIQKILLLLTLSFGYAFSIERSIESASKMTGSIMNIVMNQGDSIAGLTGDRLYLKAQNIFQSKNGYILQNERSAIVLPELSFDETGAGYLLCRSADDFKLVCSNPKCGIVFWFSDTWDEHCPRCGWIGN